MPRGQYNKGLFKPTHPEKYNGDVNKIHFRSSWEFDFCKFLDRNTRVIKWTSEPFGIPYVKPTDGRVHKYIPDFWVQYIDANGEVVQEIIELKPSTQVVQPKLAGKKKKQQIYETLTYAINMAKWKAAEQFCNKYGMKFHKITEKQKYK